MIKIIDEFDQMIETYGHYRDIAAVAHETGCKEKSDAFMLQANKLKKLILNEIEKYDVTDEYLEKRFICFMARHITMDPINGSLYAKERDKCHIEACEFCHPQEELEG